MANFTVNNRLNGLNPLAYVGANPYTPSDMLIEARAPLPTDSQNVQLGTFWLVKNTALAVDEDLYYLAALRGNVATWILLSTGAGDVVTLTGNDNLPASPLGGNINVKGDGLAINVIRSPDIHSLLIEPGTNGVPAASFITNPVTGTAVPTAAGVLTFAGTGGTVVSAAGNTVTINSTSGTVETLTGNTGGAVGPLAGNINVVGDGVSINVAGNAGTHTLTISTVGTGTVSALHSQDGNTVTPAAGVININGGNNLATTGTVGPNTLTVNLSGITQHSVQVGGAANALTQLGIGTNGQVLIGATGADPAFSTLTSIGGTIVYTSGAHTLNLDTAAFIADEYTTDAGVAVPALANLNVFGGTAGRDINTSGAGSTIHIDLNNAITLGDLAPLAANAGAVTCTTGDVIITAGDLTLPHTNVAGNQGIIKIGGVPFISDFGVDGVNIQNCFVGPNSGNTTLTNGTAIHNTGLGSRCLMSLTTGASSTMTGNGAGKAMTTATDCCGYGSGSLTSNISGDANFAYGTSSLHDLTTGSSNTALGSALSTLVTGSRNIAVGWLAAAGYNGAESDNIIIGTNLPGTVGESNVCRIGLSTGAGNSQLNKTFIAGIRGITTDNADAVPVLVDSAGQLGTVSSSERYKENIEDIGVSSVLKLRPVKFDYKNRISPFKQYGLIAEEVDEIMPELVVYKGGQPETIKYQDIPILLLNEIKKLRKEVDELKARL